MTTTEWLRPASGGGVARGAVRVGATVRAALKARSLFLRRELRRAITHHGCDTPLRALILGGTGAEVLTCAQEHREDVGLDLLLVSDACDPEVVAESIAWPLDAAVRIGARRQSALDYLLDDDATVARPHDVVIFDSVLDRVDDATAVRLLTAALARVRVGGTVAAATFDLGVAELDRDGFAAILGHHGTPRSYVTLVDVLAAIAAPSFRAGILERGPNRWVVLERT